MPGLFQVISFASPIPVFVFGYSQLFTIFKFVTVHHFIPVKWNAFYALNNSSQFNP